VEIESATLVSCPPHYWLIETRSLHSQHWTCQRCGAHEVHDDPPKGVARWEPPERHRKPRR
jgi:hypothetical protein